MITPEFLAPPAPETNIMESSIVGPKRSLKLAVFEAQRLHSVECPGTSPIVLGMEEDFLPDYGEDDKLIHWIENGKVFALIKCPDREHEELSNGIAIDIRDSLTQALGRYVRFGGSSRTMICNSHGCHAVFEKEPDQSVIIRRKFEGIQRYPLIVIEVASKHETMHMLMCQMASWLESPSDVRMAIAVNLRHLSTGFVVEIFVFVSNQPAENTPEDLDKLSQFREILSRRKSGLESLSKEETKRFCDPNPAINFRDSAALSETYGLNLLWYALFDREPKSSAETCFSVDLNFLLAKTTLISEEKLLMIDLFWALRDFFE